MGRFLIVVLSAVLLSGVLSGCATSPMVKDMQKVEREEYITISERVSYRFKNVFSEEFEYGLLPGMYRAEKENDTGTFYRGEGNRVWCRNVSFFSKSFALWQGGVWVPKSGGSPRVYQIIGTPTLVTKDLDSVDQSIAKAPTDGLANMAGTYTENAALTGQPVASAAVGSALGVALVGAMIQSSADEPIIWAESKSEEFNDKVAKGLHVSGSP